MMTKISIGLGLKETQGGAEGFRCKHRIAPRSASHRAAKDVPKNSMFTTLFPGIMVVVMRQVI